MSLRSRLEFITEPAYIMDGSAFLFRSFYAYRNMTRSDGFPTNAIFLLARLLLKIIREERPQNFIFVLDGKGKNFRHEKFPDYKANRSATPDDLVKQIDPIKTLLELLGIPLVVSDNCEADDVIASLAFNLKHTQPVVIIGADKDLKQCLSDGVVLWDPGTKEEKIGTYQVFKAENGIEPSSWPDVQALAGDSADNIPGISKIGPKTALTLIRDFPTLEELFSRLVAVPPKIRVKLEGQKDNALLYRNLTRLRTDLYTVQPIPDIKLKALDGDSAARFMHEYELRSLLREIEMLARRPASCGDSINSGAKAFSGAKPQTEIAAGLQSGLSGQQTAASKTVEATEASAAKVQFTVVENVDVIPAGQGSLLENIQTAFIPAETLEELPFNSDETLPLNLSVIIWGKSLLVAGKNWERLYKGNQKSFFEYLHSIKNAGLDITVPSLKNLCRIAPDSRILPAAVFFDLSLAAYLLNPEDRGYEFDQIVARWGELASCEKNQVNLGANAFCLGAYLKKALSGSGLTAVYTELELPLASVLAKMEERGIKVDLEAFSSFLIQVQKSLDELTTQIYQSAGREFNIRSAQQLGEVLFVDLALPKSGKTKGGATSTSQESLEKLHGKHPIIDLLFEFRKLEKLRSTYLEPLPKLVVNGRIHTSFNQTATATGRLSSSNPNLQNIPIRGVFGPKMRACFTAEEGKLLVCADYSQIELRVLAHLSGDPTLLEAFCKNEDIHSRTAGLLYDVAAAEVTAEQRRNAKTINFGLIYGMGAQKLARELKVSLNEAKAFMERYFARLGRLKDFYDSIEEDAKLNGFVATMAGRRRFTPDINSQNNQIRSQARRQAVNTRIQGSAADIIKLAMLAVESDAKLKELGAILLLQIHDELVLEAPEANAAAAAQRLTELMEAVKPAGAPLSVPLLVECGIGENWAEAH